MYCTLKNLDFDSTQPMIYIYIYLYSHFLNFKVKIRSRAYSILKINTKKRLSITGKPHKIKVFIDYSTIVATRPEPTVRPPSRRQWIIILVFPFDKYAFLRCFLDVFIFYNSILQNN